MQSELHGNVVHHGVEVLLLVSMSTSCKRIWVLLAIDNRVKMCQLVKGRRALQSIVGEYDVGKSTVHDIMKSEENVLAIQKASKHSQMEEEWSLLQLSHLQKLPANHCRQCSHTYVYTSSNNPVYPWELWVYSMGFY